MAFPCFDPQLKCLCFFVFFFFKLNHVIFALQVYTTLGVKKFCEIWEKRIGKFMTFLREVTKKVSVSGFAVCVEGGHNA